MENSSIVNKENKQGLFVIISEVVSFRLALG